MGEIVSVCPKWMLGVTVYNEETGGMFVVDRNKIGSMMSTGRHLMEYGSYYFELVVVWGNNTVIGFVEGSELDLTQIE